MRVTFCHIGTTEFYVADTQEDILSDDCEFLCESDGKGTNSLAVEKDSGEGFSLEADINLDDSVDVSEFEGKFLKIIFIKSYGGNIEFEEDDEVDLEEPLLIEYGLFSSIPLKDGDWLEIEAETEYDSPEISTSYFIVKDGVAIELEEQEDELYYLENGKKV